MTKENKMGTMPVGRLLFTMATPIVISMLVQAMYNIVDSIFVSAYDPSLLGALSLAFPAQNLMIGVATGTAVGFNAILSRSLGEKNAKMVGKSAGNGIFLEFCGTLLFVIFGLFGAHAFLSVQSGDLPTVLASEKYLRIVCAMSIGLFGQITFERLLQSTGKSLYSMITQITGAVINIILDPILIFGYFGLPALGIEGAAIATVIGQCIAACVGAFFHFKVNREIKLHPRDLILDRALTGRIIAIAVPSILVVCIGSLTNMGLNRIVDGFGAEGVIAIAVLGAYFKLQSFVFMPVFGLNNGLVPIIAYNYGAGNRRRMLKAFRLAIYAAVALMVIGLLLMQIIPGQLLLLFNADEALLEIGIPALRTISLSFVFAGFCIVVSSTFQALGKGSYSMLLSAARQLIVLLPAAYLLSLSGNLGAVWYSFPIAEIASVTVALILFLRIYKRILSRIPDQNDA